MRPRILFCTITDAPGHGGIARVSSLVWQTIQECFPGYCERLIASSSPTGEVTPSDKLRFSTAVAQRQFRGLCDVVFFDHLGLARTQNVVPKAARRPYGVFLHSIEAWAPLTRGRLAALKQAKLRVANSHYTAARVSSAHAGVGPIKVCHLSLAQESLPEAIEAETAASPCEVLKLIRPESVLITGRIMKSERHKGHAELIRAWPAVLREVPRAQLVIVGRGDGVNELRDLADRVGVERHVLFTGFLDDRVLRQVYDRVSMFAMPSLYEGFGIVYLEAMFHHLACIGSVHDAAREVIADGRTGFLVDQGDLDGTASKIIQLLKDPCLRAQFGENGKRRLEEHFSPENFRVRFSSLLQELSQ
ncbi:MAG TPA: glycosyltransferase family 4 protein [Bryobacteraceae bacterium]|nr:glycosyltransferase family 4 protein [Bryobacteraceae bacterium]